MRGNAGERQMRQLSNGADSLNAKIRKEIEENEGSTWSEWRVKLCDCVEQKNRVKSVTRGRRSTPSSKYVWEGRR